VLLVEDNPDHALLVRIAAERALAGIALRVVEDGSEAIAYLKGATPFDDRDRHPPPDLMLLDLMLPEVSGFQVLEWIRADGRFAALPVVVFTSSVNPHDERRALMLGARAFHTKPADLIELADMVRRIVTRWLPGGERRSEGLEG